MGARAILCFLVVALGVGAGCSQPLNERDATAPIDAEVQDASPQRDGAVTDDADAMAPGGQWTWIPMDDVTCADGSHSGIGVNLTQRSSDVLILMQGGGACWDGTSCYVTRLAVHIDSPYGPAEFDNDVVAGRPLLVFDRTSPDNPFRDANYVFVPYCTADVHSGNRVVQYSALGQTHEVHHVGAQNMSHILARLASMFAAPRRVWLAGLSAGGFGAILNWEAAQRAFPGVRVDVLSDCGDPVTPVGHWAEWQAAWNIQLPPGCATCTTDLTAVVDHGSALSPASRFALLAFDQDAVISMFYGIDGVQLQASLLEFQHHADSMAQWRYFEIAGVRHVMMPSARSLAAADGQTLRGFLAAYATDDPTWHSSHP